jgi:5-(carboxyamino)imidazole ribonucleotide synthase
MSRVIHRFPTVGIIGAGHMARMAVAPAISLGVTLKLFTEDKDDSAAQICDHVIGNFRNLEEVLTFARDCDVVTFEHGLIPLSIIKGLEAEGIRVYPRSSSYELLHEEIQRTGDFDSVESGPKIAVMVARSPHSQASTWVPTEIVTKNGECIRTVSPARSLSNEQLEQASSRALMIAERIGLVGVLAVEMFLRDNEVLIHNIDLHPHSAGNWTIEGSVTSQFEQHLRAILDLPLGDPAMTAPFAVMGKILGGEKSDMYRPYLHLMARNPELKFHQYRSDVQTGSHVGHVSAVGYDLLHLEDLIVHACDYMSGEIDE